MGISAKIRLIRYIYPTGDPQFSLVVELGDDKAGSVSYADRLTYLQVMGLLMAGVPCEEIIVTSDGKQQ